MANGVHDSLTEIINRILEYLKDDDGLDMIYLNAELVNLSECLERKGVKELDINELGILLQGTRIIESQLKSLGLVSHLLKNIRDSIYDGSV